jgi:iron complex outermembrane receptor protein
MKSIIVLIGLLLAAPNLLAQTITGSVCDAKTGQSLSGASVAQKDTRTGVATRPDGTFSINLSPDAPKTLIVRFLGYETKEVSVEGHNASDELRICLDPQAFRGDELVVQGVRVDANSAVTHSNISKEEIAGRNLGRDLPYMLEMLPSVVTTSDAGAGVGYTGMRIRGVDQARINVTVNGIPLNDTESHEVFWVNMPDFSSSVQSMQVQRGVGTSSNGAAAFGASVNILTDAASAEPRGSITSAIGSFNTRRLSLETGTGLLDGLWSIDGRLSTTHSDGYIDRAFSDLNAWYVSGARTGSRSQLKVNVFSGKERTYQAWNGVPEEMLAENRRFNEFTYENQVDNYRQTHTQLHYTLQVRPTVSLHTALHYTRGLGYYEEFREDDRLDRYGIPAVVIEGTTISRADLVRRRWLDNHFYGAVGSVEIRPDYRFALTVGGAYNIYDGDHFGEVIWARFAGNSSLGDRYYDNNGLKTDASGYAKASYKLSDHLEAFGDLQVRRIDYRVDGLGSSRETIDQDVDYIFVNPKAGLSYQLSEGSRVYAGFGVAQKEPTRKEFIESPAGEAPSPERLNNLELGWRLQTGSWQLGVGAYWMDYKDQLILTGEVNQSGSYVRTNVPESYRVGVELDGTWRVLPTLNVGGSLTLSRNRIVDFVEYVDVYEGWDWVGQRAIEWDSSPIGFSPAVIGGAMVQWAPARGVDVRLDARHVSRQYLDNTGAGSRSLNPYTFANLSLGYQFGISGLADDIRLQLTGYNIGDALYESNGYTFGWIQDEERLAYNYYYPQAGRNVMLQVRVHW